MSKLSSDLVANNDLFESKNQTQSNPFSSFDISMFEVKDGKINLTKIVKHFGKNLNDWTKTKQTQAFLTAFSISKAETNIIVSQKGGNGEQGSWTTYREVAIKLAQWISPQFEVYCIKKLDELFQTGKTELQPSTPSYALEDPIERAKAWIKEQEAKQEAEKQAKLLAKENSTLAIRDLEVKTEKEYKWKSRVVLADKGRSVNWFVNKYFKQDGVSFSEAHNAAKRAFRIHTGQELPSYAKDMSVEQKNSYLAWLSTHGERQGLLN